MLQTTELEQSLLKKTKMVYNTHVSFTQNPLLEQKNATTPLNKNSSLLYEQFKNGDNTLMKHLKKLLSGQTTTTLSTEQTYQNSLDE